MNGFTGMIPIESIKLVIEQLTQKNNLAVVDLACGKGWFLFGLFDDSDLSFRLMEGVDTWKEEFNIPRDFDLNLEYNSQLECKRQSNPQFISHKKDLNSFIFSTSYFYDLIILSNILHFFDREEIISILTQCQKLLSTNGIIFVKMANEKHPYAQEEDKTVFDSGLKEELEGSFDIIKMVEHEKNLEFVISKKEK